MFHISWSELVRRKIESKQPGVLRQLDGNFAFVPVHLKTGPWAWAPTLVFAGLWAATIGSLPIALAAYKPLPEAPDLRFPRLLGFVYGASVLAYMFRKYGSWPMVSWTMLGWLVTTLRYLAGILGMGGLARVLLFPALAANTITFFLWYTAILPGIVLLAPKPKRLAILRGLVLSLFLFTVHGINLPFALADFAWQPVPLNKFDLWMGLVYSMSYLTFYLWFLDPIGAHFYFILSPRRWWGAAVYLGILLLGTGILKAFNFVWSPGSPSTWVRGSPL